MRMNMYTIYDKIAEESGPLFTAKNDKVALRNFEMMIQKVDPTSKNDFQLYELGSYHDGTMHIIPNPQPVLVACDYGEPEVKDAIQADR